MHESTEPRPITFEEALVRSRERVRHLLLGNGFSISARPSFRYEALARSARLSKPVRALFADTNDFEIVLQQLRNRMADPLAGATDLAVWEAQEREIRESFIDVLQRVHPEHSMMMSSVECDRCATFLEHFVGRIRTSKFAGRVYTTNYDLLLYWVVARSGRRLWCQDLHINPNVYSRQPYGLWDPGWPKPHKVPSLLYLHGALHTYDALRGGQGMLRYDGRRNLIDQSRARLAAGKFPVIVAEGSSDAKVGRIARSEYLTWAARWFRTGLRNRNAVLFTYGHSLDLRDTHLIKQIGHGRISAVYVGAWQGLEGDQAGAIREWAHRWQELREPDHPLAIYVYDTSRVSPWTYPIKDEG
jgi:hypothetical protein